VEGKPSVFRLGLPFDKTAVNFPCSPCGIDVSTCCSPIPLGEEIAASALSLAPLKTQKVLRDHARLPGVIEADASIHAYCTGRASERILLNDNPLLFILQKRILIIFKKESLNLGWTINYKEYVDKLLFTIIVLTV